DGGNVENGPPAPLRDHVRNGGAAHADDVHQVLLDGLGPGRVIEADELAQGRRAIVVDEDIDAAEAVDSRLDDPGAILGTAAIRGNRHDPGAGFLPKLLCGLGETRLAPCRDDDPGALGRERAGDAVADAHAGATDNRHLAIQSEVHAQVWPLKPISAKKRSALRQNTFSSTS